MLNIQKFINLPFLFVALFSNLSAEEIADPILKIGSKSYRASELLKRSDIEILKLNNVPAYPGLTIELNAIKAVNLFEGASIEDDQVIQFRCIDNYNNVISKERMLATAVDQSTAYIAIEDPAAKWPLITAPGHTGTAGPFYLVWKNPKLSEISGGEWPFKLSGFEVKGTLEALYPKIFPKNKDEQTLRGFKRFQKTCFSCHQMNGEGASLEGPDLNLPMNPTEYFKEAALLKYIRNPKSIRTWDASKMPEFGEDSLSDEDIKDIVYYLKVMASER